MATRNTENPNDVRDTEDTEWLNSSARTETPEAKEARDKAINSLKYEILENWRMEDDRVTSELLLDLVALLRTGKMSSDLNQCRLSLATGRYGTPLEIHTPHGDTIEVRLERRISHRPDARDLAEELYAGGRRPVKDRSW